MPLDTDITFEYRLKNTIKYDSSLPEPTPANDRLDGTLVLIWFISLIKKYIFFFFPDLTN
jgi:hypothetical protein